MTASYKDIHTDLSYICTIYDITMYYGRASSYKNCQNAASDGFGLNISRTV